MAGDLGADPAPRLSLADWDARFAEQARWTAALRQYAYRQAGLRTARRVLEVGCGTGQITAELARHTGGSVTALDRDFARLAYAARTPQSIAWLVGDGLRLPLAGGRFQVAVCHYYLLWVGDPLRALRELRRVLAPGGTLLALAEPDYGGRVDFPPALAEAGRLQTAALRAQGADPEIGRRLAGLVRQAGFQAVETGVLSGQWRWPAASAEDGDGEWQVLVDDLRQAGLAGQVDLDSLYQVDRQACQSGERVLFIPTFYAIAR